jgi:CubicO group peptidase (beta-lactamase class C family)
MRSPTLKLAAVLALALLSACSTAPRRPDTVARDDIDAVRSYVTQLIRQEMAANNIAGMSIALVDDQKVVWAEGFGDADKENHKPASAETIYRVGSISKLFTATAAMQLAEQKKLDLDRPLKDVLPEFSIRSRFENSDPITPRNLMTHHSGLPHDLVKGMFTRNPEPFTEVLAHLKTVDTAYPPNQMFSYSNLGVSLLGHAIQEASGTPFVDYVQQSVLQPLAMTTARFEPGPAESDLMAKPYSNGTLVEELPLRDVPAGGLNASVLDLGRFLAMVFGDGRIGETQVLRPESVREMLRAQNTNVPLDLNFNNGLGWMLSTLGSSTIQSAGLVAHHAGATIHYRAQLYALPEQKLGVVVLANSSSAGRSVDRVATETLSLALEAKAGIQQPKPEIVPPASTPWPVDKLQAYVGDYTSPYGHIHVRLDSGRLRAEALGRSFELVPRADGQLRVQYKWLGMLPVHLGPIDAIGITSRKVAGHDVLIASVGSQEMLVGERVQPPSDLEPWLKRLGRYEITNIGDDHAFVSHVTLSAEDGFVVVELIVSGQMGPPQRLILKPLSDHAAVLLEQLADGGGTLRCVDVGNEERCSYAGYTLKRVAN